MSSTAPVSQPTLSAADYHPHQGIYDELLTAEGQLRSPWEGLLASLGKLSHHELAARRDSIRRLLREHGATYNVYADGPGLGRPWSLDLLPLPIAPREWRQIEAGLIQRTRVLNLLLADLYGARRMLSEGGLPPALLYANPGFLRPCHGLRPPKDIYLFFHAVDLARSPDGHWWVLADRTQAPSGSGYALENRLVLSHILPDEFRDCRVQRLAGFFQTTRDTLQSLAPGHSDQPTVVLLTPGPHNETYFEQAFLARYLGFPLVESGDLTVRDRRVFIKTLEGLQGVDVILRRTDDTYCDPLELRADSSLGVPGLLEAARAGNVAIANPLGSGAVEAPALMAFLPGLCRHLLGEELTLPSIATWWCGQEHELAYVRAHLEQLVVSGAFASAAADPIAASTLDSAAREQLLQAIQAAPFNFIGQEQVSLSCVPVLDKHSLEPRPMILRAYICAGPNGYVVMPGGLTRYSTAPDRQAVSGQSGGASKDTWVLSEGPVNPLTLIKPTAPVMRVERAAAQVPSRIADNLFWLGRYAERIEDTVRLLRCGLNRLVGERADEENAELAALVGLLCGLGLFPPELREQMAAREQLEQAFHARIYQPHRLGTIGEITNRLRSLAFALRDRLSADTWHILNKLQVDAHPRSGPARADVTLALLNTLVADLAAFSGMEMENMTRGHAWRFLDIGRRLERGINSVTLTQAALRLQPPPLAVLQPMLEIADSVMTYRRRYFAHPQWPAVLDLLLSDEANPRSLAFQVRALADHALQLPGEEPHHAPDHPAALVAALRAALVQADWATLADSEAMHRGFPEAAALLNRCALGLRTLSDTITRLYFSHADTRVR